MDEDNSGAVFSNKHQAQISLLARHAVNADLANEAAAHRVFKIRTAESSRDRGWARGLVDRMYATRGYQCSGGAEEQSDLRKTFLASDCNSAVGTLTIGFDSESGLAVDELFPDDTNKFRSDGYTLCEFTKLAMDRRVRSPRVLAALFHVAHLYAHKIKTLKTLLIEVNPRHVKYYEVMLGFKVVCEERHNPRVNAPAVLLALDLMYAHEQILQFGGKPHLAATERSAYPYFFSSADEVGILNRLSCSESEITTVYVETAHVGRQSRQPGPSVH